MPIPSNGILDNFNRADGSPGSNWSVAKNTYSVPSIILNELNWSQYPSMYWNPTVFDADQEIFVKTDAGAGGSRDAGLLFRWNNPGGGSENGYYLHCSLIDPYYAELFKIVSGSGTTLGYFNGVLDPADIWVWVTAIGSAITLYGSADGVHWTLRRTWTDTTFSGSGYIGLYQQNNGGGPYPRLDDFGGGSIVAVTLDDCLSDADITTTGWTTTPLFSKVNDASDATVIQATAA